MDGYVPYWNDKNFDQGVLRPLSQEELDAHAEELNKASSSVKFDEEDRGFWDEKIY